VPNTYGSWLPAGEYRISSWGGCKWPEYDHITVQAGTVTDLGNLISFNIGGYEFVVLPVRVQETAADIGAVLEKFRPYLVSTQTIQWNPARPPAPFAYPRGYTLGVVQNLIADYNRYVNMPPRSTALRQTDSNLEFFRLIKSMTAPLYDSPAVDADSNLYFGADLGQIRLRRSKGTWESIDTGTLHPITAVAVHEKMLVAGSDDGIVRISLDLGRTWVEKKPFAAGEGIVAINRAGAKWLVVTTHLAKEGSAAPDVELYKFERDDFSDLSRIREGAIDRKTAHAPWYGVHAQLSGNFYYIDLLPELLRLNVDTMIWQKVTPPIDMTDFRVSPTTGALAAFRALGAFSKLYVSTDRGEHWSQYESPPYVIQDVRFDSADSGSAVRAHAEAFTVELQIMQYNRARDQWHTVNTAPQGCMLLLHDALGEARFCRTTGNNILSFQDGAWITEFGSP
jgi:hypothetical protein